MVSGFFVDYNMSISEEFNYILKNYINDRRTWKDTPAPRKEIDDRWPTRLYFDNIPSIIDSFFHSISTEKGEKQYWVRGSSGEGDMSVSPWIGIFDRDITTSARKEYAVVYLFDTGMKRIYLSLNQGWTQYEDSIMNKKGEKGNYASPFLEFKDTESAANAISKNAKLAQNLINSSQGFSFKKIDLTSDIDPIKGKVSRNKHNLAWGYELGNILSKCYKADEIPSKEEIIEDLSNMIGIYRELKGLLNGISITQIEQEDYRSPTYKTDSKEELNDKNDEDDEREGRTAANAAITGNKAEEIFELESQELGYEVKNMTKTTGLGYDFISIDKKTFFEIKGFRDEIGFGDFRMTKTEWKVAKEKSDNYLLVLINNVFSDGNYRIKIIEDPYNTFRETVEEKETNPVRYYFFKKRHI